MDFAEFFNIQKGITSIIGAGGKTSLILKLACGLKKRGRVIITTTTHIQNLNVKTVTDGELFEKGCDILDYITLVISSKNNELHNITPVISSQHLASLAPYILVEADGARMLPFKAHAIYEPVIPNFSNGTINVIGAHSFGKEIGKVVHRSKILCTALKVNENEILTPRIASDFIKIENLSKTIFINGVETEQDKKNTLEFASYLKGYNISCGSTIKGVAEWLCI